MFDLRRLRRRAAEAGFDASLDDRVGQLLTVLAASKPAGRFLELGTGVGLGTAYLLQGADAASRLLTIELEPHLSAIAQTEITDQRVSWLTGDGGVWLQHADHAGGFDLVFADTWPGKFSHLDRAIALVEPGGHYVIDDLRPQPNWPADHQLAVDRLIAQLESHPRLATVRLDWASGVMVCTRTTGGDPAR